MAVFFTADTHFFHENIIRHDNRPYKSIEDMHEQMKEKWNKKVSRSDDVYILGDFSWRISDEHIRFLRTLNGRKHLIVGNHDPRKPSKKYRELFVSIDNMKTIKVEASPGNYETCVLSHFFMPFYDGHYHGNILLHGHSHNTREHCEEIRIAKDLEAKGFPNRIFNVGCMHWNYEPVTLAEILSYEFLNIRTPANTSAAIRMIMDRFTRKE